MIANLEPLSHVVQPSFFAATRLSEPSGAIVSCDAM
jgi:hypothetical protein